jgi:hypothetical protein
MKSWNSLRAGEGVCQGDFREVPRCSGASRDGSSACSPCSRNPALRVVPRALRCRRAKRAAPLTRLARPMADLVLSGARDARKLSTAPRRVEQGTWNISCFLAFSLSCQKTPRPACRTRSVRGLQIRGSHRRYLNSVHARHFGRSRGVRPRGWAAALTTP